MSSTVIPFPTSAARIERELRRAWRERYLARQIRVHFSKGFGALCGGKVVTNHAIGVNSPAFPDGITCKNCLRKMKTTAR